MLHLKGTKKVLPEGAKFAQTEVKESSETYKAATEAISKSDNDALKKSEYVKVYDFSLTDSNNTAIHQLEGYISVTFDAPSDLTLQSNETVCVYRVEVSTYIVAKVEKTNAVKTGDISDAVIWMMIAFAGGIILVAGYKMRQQNAQTRV